MIVRQYPNHIKVTTKLAQSKVRQQKRDSEINEQALKGFTEDEQAFLMRLLARALHNVEEM